MTASLHIHGIGAQVSVHADGPRAGDLQAALEVAWSRCLPATSPATPGGEPDAGDIHLRLNNPGDVEPTGLDRHAGELVSDDLASLLCTGTQAITYALIRAQAGRALMFHAGAVSHPTTGKTLVYVAEGGTGKTTLSRTLGRRYGYLTDETVAIDADNTVLPYPKPLSVRTGKGWPKVETSPDSLRLAEVRETPVVARVIILDRDPDLTDPEITELPLLEAIARLTPQSSSLYALPRGLHRCADLIADTGPVMQIRYAEAESLIPLAADLIGAI